MATPPDSSPRIKRAPVHAAYVAVALIGTLGALYPRGRSFVSERTPQLLRETALQGPALLAPAAASQAPWQRGGPVARRARIDGEYGVLEESPSPIIDPRTLQEDPLLEKLVAVVQAADKKRGVDMSAFWIHEGWEIVVVITALSRPQLQAIAQEIDFDMRKKLRVKRVNRHMGSTSRGSRYAGTDIRSEAASGWVCLSYERLNVQIMTPVQRAYYDIEGTWRDDNQDYEKIPLDDILREEGFGNMRLTKELGGTPEEGEKEEEEEVVLDDLDEELDYEEDEEDPFWS